MIDIFQGRGSPESLHTAHPVEDGADVRRLLQLRAMLEAEFQLCHKDFPLISLKHLLGQRTALHTTTIMKRQAFT